MADAISILGVFGQVMQIGEVLFKFGMDWKNAPNDVRENIANIQALKTTLSTTYANSVSNPEFEKAMRGADSALLRHFGRDSGGIEKERKAIVNSKAKDGKASEGKTVEVKAKEGKGKEVNKKEEKAKDGKSNEVKAKDVKSNALKAKEVKGKEVKEKEGREKEVKAKDPTAKDGKANGGNAKEVKAKEGKAKDGKANEVKTKVGKAKLDRLVVTTCTRKLGTLLAELKDAAASSSVFSWKRIEMVFRKNDIRDAIANLQRQCQLLNNLVGIDSLTLAVQIVKEVRLVRREANEDRQARRDWESKNDRTLGRIEHNIDNQDRDNALEKASRLLNLISTYDYASQQRDYLSNKTEGTGRWLIEESENYRRWVDGTGKTLFCHGIPGSGKTIMSSIVIHDIAKRIDNTAERIDNSADVYLAFVYCNFRVKHARPLESILSSILRQVVQQMRRIPDHIENLYAKGKSLPSLCQIEKALALCIQSFKRGYVVIDALDEFSTNLNMVKKLANLLKKMQRQTGLNLLVTTRQIYRAQDLFPASTCIELEIRANDSDVGKYVRRRLRDFPSYVQRDQQLREKIQSAIIQSVEGMFLLAKLHLESLTDKKSPRAMMNALEELNSGDDPYKMAYRKAMRRIHGQTDGQRQLAMQVLSWITFAKRPLTTNELQHALAVDIDGTASLSFDQENVTDIDFIMSVCAGLVTVDEIAGVIRLVHHTAQQYFDQNRAEHFPSGDSQIAATCLRYLGYGNVSPAPLVNLDQYRERLKTWPLYAYASEYWHEHANKTKQHREIRDFLGQQIACGGAYQTAVIARYSPYNGSAYHFVSWDFHNGSAGSMALHWAAFIGDEALARELLQAECDVNQEDFEGMTPIMVAARQGHSGLVRMLLRDWKAEATTSKQGKSPILYAATFNHEEVVRALLEDSGVDRAGSAPLGQAIALGHVQVVKRLLDDPRVEPYVAVESGASGLTIAAESGYPEIVKLLLRKNEVEVKYKGRDALRLALQKGHNDIALQLVGDERIYTDLNNARGLEMLSSVVESGDEKLLSKLLRKLDTHLSSKTVKRKTTPLILAVQTGRLELVLSLLAKKKYDINAADEFGRTAVSWAAEAGTGKRTGSTRVSSAAPTQHGPQGMSILRALLETNGVEPGASDMHGKPPLFYAAEGSCVETISLLLTLGRVPVDTPGPLATTALFHVNKAPIAGALINAGADCNWKNTMVITPLLHIYQERPQLHNVLELLCRKGAELQIVGQSGYTILLCAAKCGDPWMVNLLLKHRASINDPGRYDKSILYAALAYAPKSVSDAFLAVSTSRSGTFEYNKNLLADGTAKDLGSDNIEERYRVVVGLLLGRGASKSSLNQLELLKLKSKNEAA